MNKETNLAKQLNEVEVKAITRAKHIYDLAQDVDDDYWSLPYINIDAHWSLLVNGECVVVSTHYYDPYDNYEDKEQFTIPARFFEEDFTGDSADKEVIEYWECVANKQKKDSDIEYLMTIINVLSDKEKAEKVMNMMDANTNYDYYAERKALAEKIVGDENIFCKTQG